MGSYSIVFLEVNHKGILPDIPDQNKETRLRDGGVRIKEGAEPQGLITYKLPPSSEYAQLQSSCDGVPIPIQAFASSKFIAQSHVPAPQQYLIKRAQKAIVSHTFLGLGEHLLMNSRSDSFQVSHFCLRAAACVCS